eukprot:m.288289 g.288289  ORF g.288289 m.288289 type:complete len:118 (-) comp22934_c2_seq4:217-570(-)
MSVEQVLADVGIGSIELLHSQKPELKATARNTPALAKGVAENKQQRWQLQTKAAVRDVKHVQQASSSAAACRQDKSVPLTQFRKPTAKKSAPCDKTAAKRVSPQLTADDIAAQGSRC